MEQIATTPDIYEPVLDENGFYVDAIPKFDEVKKARGMRCQCSKREHVFMDRANLQIHSKSKAHQDWLQRLNANRTNHLTESIQLRETVDQQRILIAQQDRTLQQNKCIIDALTDKLNSLTVIAKQFSVVLEGPRSLQTTLTASTTTNLLELDE